MGEKILLQHHAWPKLCKFKISVKQDPYLPDSCVAVLEPRNRFNSFLLMRFIPGVVVMVAIDMRCKVYIKREESNRIA